jgi:hypothetical protein
MVSGRDVVGISAPDKQGWLLKRRSATKISAKSKLKRGFKVKSTVMTKR